MTVLIGAADAARVLGCSVNNITRLRQHGTLRAARRNPFRYRLADVQAYHAKRSQKRVDRRVPVVFIEEKK